MWTLNKPDMALAIGKDIDELVAHCNDLQIADKNALKTLYKNYDTNNGSVTTDDLLPLDAKKNIILRQYESKFQKKQCLRYIRDELLDKAKITKCPCCGINEPSQLDHFMDKSTYGQLACCRLNLVPLCGCCNLKKHDQTYTNYVHAYYDRYPDVDFLITKVTVKNNHIGFVMTIDKSVITDTNLARRTERQFSVISDGNRFQKAGINYLCDFIHGLRCRTNRSLRTMIKRELDYDMKAYGRNHWKTSIIRGLLNCLAFDMNVVNEMNKPKVVRMENGIGA